MSTTTRARVTPEQAEDAPHRRRLDAPDGWMLRLVIPGWKAGPFSFWLKYPGVRGSAPVRPFRQNRDGR